MWKYGQEDFFPLHMWNLNIKVIDIIKLVQIILNTWFGYFKYFDYLSHGIA